MTDQSSPSKKSIEASGRVAKQLAKVVLGLYPPRTVVDARTVDALVVATAALRAVIAEVEASSEACLSRATIDLVRRALKETEA
jgi:Na+-translocating ferredoxin:NAD+ oxidoreductase RNF subunit RnfB